MKYITDGFGVPGTNEKGKSVVDFNVKKDLWVAEISFKYKYINQCTRVARGREGMEVETMKDLKLVKIDMLKYVDDVKIVIYCKVKLVGR